jgi:hypothetical protein
MPPEHHDQLRGIIADSALPAIKLINSSITYLPTP